MDHLTLEQLRQIPWNKKYISGPEVPAEPDPEQIHDLINIPFMKRDSKYPLFYSWFEIIRLVGNVKPLEILDTACGRGQISQSLAFMGNRVEACDIEEYFSADRNTIKFRLADLNKKLPYDDNSFDVVINCEGLEYLEHSDLLITESARVLKPDGRLILSVPNVHSIASIVSFFREGTLTSYNVCLPERKNLIYLPLLTAQLKSHEFEITQIKGNIPLLSFNIKLFSRLSSPFYVFKSNEQIMFAHSLIIEAHLMSR